MHEQTKGILIREKRWMGVWRLYEWWRKGRLRKWGYSNDVRYQEWAEMTLGCCKESNRGSFLFIYINFYEALEGVLFFCPKSIRVIFCVMRSKRWKQSRTFAFSFDAGLIGGWIWGFRAWFWWHKKVGNAHSRLLAYRSFAYVVTIQNGKVDLGNFL